MVEDLRRSAKYWLPEPQPSWMRSAFEPLAAFVTAEFDCADLAQAQDWSIVIK